MFAPTRGDPIMLHCPPRSIPLESKLWKPNMEVAPSCPRCASSNTKFCYYNNYSMSQPRYFCKGCRRYWTKGGSLRNVPVGGGCRKTRRSKSSRSANLKNQGSNMANQGMDFNRFGGNDSLAQKDGACSSGSNIDMAAVFAKFLRNDQELPLVLSQTTTLDSVDSTSMMFYQSVKSYEMVEESNFLEGYLPNDDHNVIEDNYQEKQNNSILLELQNPLINNDQIMQLDELWSEVSESDSWQPMVQLQALDSFQELMNTSHTNLRSNYSNNNNLVSDCSNYWRSLDISTSFDNIARP